MSGALETAETVFPRARHVRLDHSGWRGQGFRRPLSQSRPDSRLSLLSRTWSCRRKPELGQISRWACTVWMASTSVMFSQIMRKARTTVAERLTPMAQWTSTRSVGRPNLALATCTHLSFGEKGQLWSSLLSTCPNTLENGHCPHCQMGQGRLKVT